jgi:hypothetical protein
MAIGQSFISNIGTAQNAISGVGAAIGTAGRLSGALSGALNATDVGSAIRSLNLPAAGEAIGDLTSAVASFGGDANANDWRVRLSLANWPSFKTSPVLAPLKDAGGLVFPYTPSIKIASGANYTSNDVTHTNYKPQSFKNSDPGEIIITAPMFCEDQSQGLYWIAMTHYLRSLTKMFTGNDSKAGNPPPVIMLNGYGNYVFKNVPVVVKNFSVTIDEKSDHIGVNVVGSAAGAIEGVADSIGGLSDSIGSVLPGLAGAGGALDTISSIAGGVGQVAGLLGSFGIGGTTSGGVSHVPVESSFSVTLIPVYSRDSLRKFSLDRFVTGGYLNNSFGYI